MLYYEPAFQLKNYCTSDCIVSLCNLDSLIMNIHPLKEIFYIILVNINASEYAVGASNIYGGNMIHLFNQNVTTEGFLE